MNRKKRRKPRKQVRCTCCTPYRWMGNHKTRFKNREQNERRETAKEMRAES